MTKRRGGNYLRMLTLCNMLFIHFGDEFHPQKSLEPNFPARISSTTLQFYQNCMRSKLKQFLTFCILFFSCNVTVLKWKTFINVDLFCFFEK